MRQIAGGALIRNGQILLGFRSASKAHYPNVWDIFGGHLEHNETPGEALFREIREELGVEILSSKFVEILREPNPEINGDGQLHVFVIDAWNGEPTNCSAEHDEIRWFDFAEMQSLELAHSGYPNLLKDHLFGRIRSNE